jgi:lysylphosphatidylglycerol synthetase-like protein (DUF2156 family)
MRAKRGVLRSMTGVSGGLLVAIGIIHAIVNLRSFARATARGEIPISLVPELAASVAMGGVFLSLLGVLLLVIGPGLARGSQTAWRIGVVIGLFFVAAGVAGYVWRPVMAVFIFSVLGGLVCVPLLIWRREFPAP